MSAEVARGRDKVARWALLLRALESGAAMLPVSVKAHAFRSLRSASSLLARALRFALLRSLAASCGELVDVREDVFLAGYGALHIGDRVSIHPFAYIDATGGLVIGNDVSIAHAVTIMTTEHCFDNFEMPIRDQPVTPGPVSVGNNVWIGAGARILAGVTLGSGSIVAAGAVVTNDVEPNSIVAGVPARVIRGRVAQ